MLGHKYRCPHCGTTTPPVMRVDDIDPAPGADVYTVDADSYATCDECNYNATLRRFRDAAGPYIIVVEHQHEDKGDGPVSTYVCYSDRTFGDSEKDMDLLAADLGIYYEPEKGEEVCVQCYTFDDLEYIST